MTLSGAIALQRPDVDRPAPLLAPVVIHDVRVVDKRGTKAKFGRLGIDTDGRIDDATGAFTATANLMSEQQRRTARIRRNGRARR